MGTARDPIKQLDSSSEIQPGELHRSGSESSLHSQRSIYSTPIAYSVPANLNLSIDEPDDEEDAIGASARDNNGIGQFVRATNHGDDEDADHDNDLFLQDRDEEGGITTSLAQTHFSAVSSSSLHSTMTLPPSYSQLSSRIPSTETCN